MFEELNIFKKRYEKIQKLGEGGFSNIYLCKDSKYKEPVQMEKENIMPNSNPQEESKECKENFQEFISKPKQEMGRFLAVKQFKQVLPLGKEKETNFHGFEIVRLMQKINHPNIMKIYDSFIEDQNLFFVLEFMPINLKQLLMSKDYQLSFEDIQHIFFQILTAIQYLHNNKFMHRDIKPSNILFSKTGSVILSDFDLLMEYTKEEKSLIATTRWYKAPELIYGNKFYDEKIDIWSLGCLFGELFKKAALFQGETDIGMLDKIFNVLGDANEDNWKGVSQFNGYWQIEPKIKGVGLQQFIGKIPKKAFYLLSQFLTLDPQKRINVDDALKHDYFETLNMKKEISYQKIIDKRYQQILSYVTKKQMSE